MEDHTIAKLEALGSLLGWFIDSRPIEVGANDRQALSDVRAAIEEELD